ncbi:MAG: hypothetical protein ACREAB_15855 [Blastocatellia bacterium]
MPFDPAKPPRDVKKNGTILLCSMVVTFALLRVSLYFTPNADLNVGRYNIHHLFTGLLLAAAGGIPLAIFQGSSRKLDLARLVFGAGLGMALDEWVYLIATDGSNASYSLPVSFWGGVIVIGLACVYTAALMVSSLRRR